MRINLLGTSQMSGLFGSQHGGAGGGTPAGSGRHGNSMLQDAAAAAAVAAVPDVSNRGGSAQPGSVPGDPARVGSLRRRTTSSAPGLASESGATGQAGGARPMLAGNSRRPGLLSKVFVMPAALLLRTMVLAPLGLIIYVVLALIMTIW